MWSYSTTSFLFVAGVSLIAIGAHMAYSNVEPQRARVQARRDFVKERLRRYLDDRES